MLPATGRPAISWMHYTTSCNTQPSDPEDGQNHCPKHVELTGIINNPLSLHLFGCLYYLYQSCTVKQISDNEIYLLIKFIKSVLWRVAKRLSYIQDVRCLKVECARNLRNDLVSQLNADSKNHHISILNQLQCLISDFRREGAENWAVLGYYAASCGNFHGGIILRWIFRKWDVGVWTGSSWLGIGTGGGHLWIR